jgi:Ni2+-binding GTPase involved in maturation of urease and hydrogenase
LVKFIVCSGTPGAGKTSILLHTIRELSLRKQTTRRYAKENIPIKVGLSNDMCPDHFAIYNTEDMLSWAKTDNLIVETAGLCLRCAPYTNNCLAICVVDTTTGPNTPLKIGPMLTTADVLIATKGDLVSQAEREVFRERVYEVNPRCVIIEANGLSGKGAAELADVIEEFEPKETEMLLRHTPPLAVCTLCTGEMKVSKKHHCGVLRSLDGFEKYEGE